MPFKVVMFHCPIIGASHFGRSKNLIEYVQPIMEDYDVDLVVHGHEHHYERGHITEDLMYMILGGAGGALDVGLRPLPETEVMTAVPCYTEVKATKEYMEFTTLSLDEVIIDQYTIYED